MENAPNASHYVMPGEVPALGPARVILGAYGSSKSPIAAPPGMTYLAVTLKKGQRWTFQTPHGHDVAWVAVHEGAIRTPPRIAAGESNYSVHTSEEALRRGEEEIRRIGATLRAERKRSYALMRY